MSASAKKRAVKKTAAKPAEIADWRAETLRRVRSLIQEAAPGVSEEQKWKKPSNPAGVPAWSQDGLICTGETYKDKVKLTFVRGAALEDPAGLFNGADTGAVRRSIDLREGDKLKEGPFKALVKAAAALNAGKRPARKRVGG